MPQNFLRGGNCLDTLPDGVAYENEEVRKKAIV